MLTRGQTARNTETAERLSLGDQMESDNGGRVFIDDNRSSRGSKTGSENGRKDEEKKPFHSILMQMRAEQELNINYLQLTICWKKF